MKKNVIVEKYISKPSLMEVLSNLAETSHLVAPTEVYGEIVFQEVASIKKIVLDYENCLNAPKDYMLLNDEVFFDYNMKTMKLKKNSKVSQNVVLFGVRGCDMRAIGLLDKFFFRDFKDPLYFEKRENLLIITVMCEMPGKNCFCTSTHSGPYLNDRFDIQLIGIGHGYFLEAGSKKGMDFVEKFAHFMSAPGSDHKSKKKEAINKVSNSEPIKFDLEKVRVNLEKSNDRDELWKDIAQRCQSCGGCLLICPTCSCFYVTDRRIGSDKGTRLRSLDACYYEGLTRMSGGYNPVLSREMMMKRKFYHKLFQQLDEFGESGCTGCGRCNDICPGNVNWLNVIKRIEEELA